MTVWPRRNVQATRGPREAGDRHAPDRSAGRNGGCCWSHWSPGAERLLTSAR